MGTWTRLIIALALTLGAFSTPLARADSTRDAITTTNQRFVKAFLSGDARAVAALYSDDAKVIGPGAAIAEGRPAIEAFWKSVKDSGVKSVKLETVEVESAGKLAIEQGRAEITGRGGKIEKVRYLVVWKRIGPRLYLHRDIWNAGP